MFTSSLLRRVPWAGMAPVGVDPLPTTVINPRKTAVGRISHPSAQQRNFVSGQPGWFRNWAMNLFYGLLATAHMGRTVIPAQITDPITPKFDVYAPSEYATMPENEFEEFKAKLEESTGDGVQVHVIDDGPGDPETCDFIYKGNDRGYIPSNPYRHDLSVCSIIKGFAFSMAQDAELHYYETDLADGLQKIYDTVQGPAVVTLSVGEHNRGIAPLKKVRNMKHERLVRKLIEEKGIVVLSAAGNEGLTEEPEWFPLSSHGTWMVGALRRKVILSLKGNKSKWSVSDFSNHGPWISYYALGEDMMTNLVPKGLNQRRILKTTDGSSFAAPLVACVIARILSVDPKATPADIRAILDRISSKVVLQDKDGNPYEAKFLPVDQKRVFSNCKRTNSNK